jgi:hypothetical protein
MADTALRRHRPLSIHAYDTLSHMYDGTAQYALLAYKFTGKERDTESGLYAYGSCVAKGASLTRTSLSLPCPNSRFSTRKRTNALQTGAAGQQA